MSKLLQRFRRDVTAVVYTAVGLFLFLSVYSFNPKDPSFNSAGSDTDTLSNYCGLIGSFLSDMILQSFGLVSYALIAAIFYKSYLLMTDSQEKMKWLKLCLGLLCISLLSSIIALHAGPHKIYDQHIYSSGLFGQILVQALLPALNYAGLAVLLWCSFLVSLLFLTEKSFSLLLAAFADYSKEFFAFVSKYTAKLWAGIKLYYKNLEKKRKAERKEEKQQERLLKSENKQESSSRFMFFDKKSEQSDETKNSLKNKLLAESEQESEDNEVEYEMDEGDELSEDTSDENEENPFEPICFEEPEAEQNGQLKLAVAETGKKRVLKIKTKVQYRVENWTLPNIKLIEDPPANTIKVSEKEMIKKTEILEDKLQQFSVKGKVVAVRPGPAVTLFEFRPNVDVKISKITELADDLSLALSSESVRIIAPIPGRDVVGIETANSQRETVYLKEIIADDDFWNQEKKLPIALGKQADGKAKIVDLRKMPHLMVAGTTGSGKSVFVVSTLIGLLFRHSPKTLRLIVIDPKKVDLSVFANAPHLLMPPICEAPRAVGALKWAIREMEKRNLSMSKFGARNLEEYNAKVQSLSAQELAEHDKINNTYYDERKREKMYYYSEQPYIVIVVEEFADLMMVDKANVESLVIRLAQMARASGIHLILATQSPRKDVVTGLIKTNIPGRISFKVFSKIDSRIILDEGGAERLLARGDMLFLDPGVAKPQRHHGPWLSEQDINKVIDFWTQQSPPVFDEAIMESIDNVANSNENAGFEGDADMSEAMNPDREERYDEILAWVASQKAVSASLLQRKFRLGYPRAARLVEILESEGVIGPANGSKPRSVLVRSDYDESPQQ